jgi:hypothetical protein
MTEDDHLKTEEYEIKILLNRPAFQQGIQDLRSDWHIPANDFPDNKTFGCKLMPTQRSVK